MSNDPLTPRGDGRGALGAPLRMVTLVTSDPEACRRFYVDVMEMEPWTGPGASRETRRAQERLWGWRESRPWDEQVFHRPRMPEVPWLRVVASPDAGPRIRPGMDARLEGGLSVGFAMHDMARAVEHGRERGFGTTAGIAALAMRRNDGSPYEALECHFRAPDDVYALGVARPADLAPVGPIEPGRNVGGPAYSAQVANGAEAVLDFYTQVLDYEIRRDVEVAGPGPERGLGLPPGTRMRFMQVFARGATTGYLVFLDFADAGRANPVPSVPPNRGVAAWTIPVRDLAEAERRIRARGDAIVGGPVTLAPPYSAPCDALSVRTANGFLVELHEYRR